MSTQNGVMELINTCIGASVLSPCYAADVAISVMATLPRCFPGQVWFVCGCATGKIFDGAFWNEKHP